mmetsp:Transcript_97849/g.169460  ORF Transcript_97849/g.169460 Transcript_97849/m.169460 type:complete len:86 (+) Transcript_97849:1294-1551(+)
MENCHRQMRQKKCTRKQKNFKIPHGEWRGKMNSQKPKLHWQQHGKTLPCWTRPSTKSGWSPEALHEDPAKGKDANGKHVVKISQC